MLIPIHKGIVENGKLILAEPQVFIGYLKTLKGDVEVIVRRRRKRRSTNQNSYYHGVVLKLIADQTGHTPEEVHHWAKSEFLKIQGRLLTARSTTKLSTIEMEEYLAKVRSYASEKLDIYIPLPNEISEEDIQFITSQTYE